MLHEHVCAIKVFGFIRTVFGRVGEQGSGRECEKFEMGGCILKRSIVFFLGCVCEPH